MADVTLGIHREAHTQSLYHSVIDRKTAQQDEQMCAAHSQQAAEVGFCLFVVFFF